MRKLRQREVMYLPKSLRSSKTRNLDSFLLNCHDLRHNSVLGLFLGKEEREEEGEREGRRGKRDWFCFHPQSILGYAWSFVFPDSYSIYVVHFFSYPWDPPICSTLELSSPILHSTLLFIASYSQPPGKDVRLLIPSYSTVGCKSLIPDPKEEKKREEVITKRW